jgi:hypothetical protein
MKEILKRQFPDSASIKRAKVIKLQNIQKASEELNALIVDANATKNDKLNAMKEELIQFQEETTRKVLD